MNSLSENDQSFKKKIIIQCPNFFWSTNININDQKQYIRGLMEHVALAEIYIYI